MKRAMGYGLGFGGLLALLCLALNQGTETARTNRAAEATESAKIVCIGAGTVRSGIQELGDIVAVHAGIVELTGSGYAHFDVIEVLGFSQADILGRLDSIRPLPPGPTDPAEPKFLFTCKQLTMADRADLASASVSRGAKLQILGKITTNSTP